MTVPLKCPVNHEYNPMVPNVVNDPFDILARAREAGPVFYMPDFDMWCVTRHEDADYVIRTWKLFDSSPFANAVQPIPDEILAIVGPDYPLPTNSDNLLTVDPPEHTRMRKAFQYAFTPKYISQHEGTIRRVVNALIDEFVDDGAVDLVSRFTKMLPMAVIGPILGMTADRASEFAHFVSSVMRAQFSSGLSEEEKVAAWKNILEFETFYDDFLADRRDTPQDDLTSKLIHAADENGDRLLNDAELRSNVLGLAVAGGDTTGILLCQTLHRLLEKPERWDALRSDFSKLPGYFEEAMRHRGPVSGFLRRARENVEIGGVPIPGGSIIYVSAYSANRDGNMFEDPNEFDPSRANAKKHVSFGAGTHNCPGQWLARLEVGIALECLAERLPNIRLADPTAELEYLPNMLFPEPVKLNVVW